MSKQVKRDPKKDCTRTRTRVGDTTTLLINHLVNPNKDATHASQPDHADDQCENHREADLERKSPVTALAWVVELVTARRRRRRWGRRRSNAGGTAGGSRVGARLFGVIKGGGQTLVLVVNTRDIDACITCHVALARRALLGGHAVVLKGTNTSAAETRLVADRVTERFAHRVTGSRTTSSARVQDGVGIVVGNHERLVAKGPRDGVAVARCLQEESKRGSVCDRHSITRVRQRQRELASAGAHKVVQHAVRVSDGSSTRRQVNDHVGEEVCAVVQAKIEVVGTGGVEIIVGKRDGRHLSMGNTEQKAQRQRCQKRSRKRVMAGALHCVLIETAAQSDSVDGGQCGN